MPNPTQRDEREKLEKREEAKKPPPPPPKEDISLGGTLKKIDERKKLLDET